MSLAVLDVTPPVPADVPGGPGLEDLVGLVDQACAVVDRAAGVSLGSVSEEGSGAALAGLAGLESRAASLRLALAAEADRRRVAEESAETGTDAWVARLTGCTREQAAGGLWLAGLLQDRYAATREAFAAGVLRVEQVRVIVAAAEQAPVRATAGQVAAAEAWLVAKATGAGTRSGRGLDARGLRQAARRMFAVVDAELAVRHEAILLGREARRAEGETFFSLHDNGDGSFSGRFRIPQAARPPPAPGPGPDDRTPPAGPRRPRRPDHGRHRVGHRLRAQPARDPRAGVLRAAGTPPHRRPRRERL
jgi:hypothetical protein